MILSIHQPAYLPWCGYLQRIAAGDLHVVLDHVQFEKNSFINRNRIRTHDGPAWLTVPVLTSGRFGELPINEVTIDNTQHWREKHWRTLLQSYRKSPYFAEHAPFFERVYRHPWQRLVDLIDATTGYLLRAFGVQTSLERSSVLGVRGAKDELVLNLCRACGATIYYSGPLGRDYLRREPFDAAGIGLVFQDYQGMPYVQHGFEGFEPNLSAIDLLFNYGPAARLVMLRGGAATKGTRLGGPGVPPGESLGGPGVPQGGAGVPQGGAGVPPARCGPGVATENPIGARDSYSAGRTGVAQGGAGVPPAPTDAFCSVGPPCPTSVAARSEATAGESTAGAPTAALACTAPTGDCCAEPPCPTNADPSGRIDRSKRRRSRRNHHDETST